MTINGLIEATNLSRYYVTKAIRGAGIEISRGRRPTMLSQDETRKVKKILRSMMMIKSI